ncbi:MAG: hypothetical protein QOG04_839 [Actinomycetota bacterium]|jgi:hypothetical protein|nr:hypothetical protein [Actinomycetota bacterium]
MRKILVAALTVGLVAGSLGAPAGAKARPRPVTLYLHGPFVAGEVDYVETTANSLQGVPDGFQVMDTVEPTETVPDSMGLTNLIASPNRYCDGNALFPTWEGKVTGKITGDITVYLNTASEYVSMVYVDVFADTTGGCDSATTGASDYIEPVASGGTSIPPGMNKIVLKNVDFSVMYNLVIMVTPASMALVGERHDFLSHGRVLYDAVDYASRVEFRCAPVSGKSCVPSS